MMKELSEWAELRGQLPDKAMTASGAMAAKQPYTTANVLFAAVCAEVTARFNMMTHTLEVSSPDGDSDRALHSLFDALEMLTIAPREKRTVEVMTEAAMADRFHPMLDWVDSVPWDGYDRVSDLAATVPTETSLWPVYLRKWLIQVMEGIAGWDVEEMADRSLPHVVVFTGGQAAGKGRWIRQLAPGYVLADAELHLSGHSAKDHMISVLKRPVVELGEIDSTFGASDISMLKSFLSRPVDEIRGAYARLAPARPRMSCFIGSVNNLDFLVDKTGSRRFWPVEVTEGETLTWDHGLDMQQLWAQVLVLWESGEDWNLSEDDDAEREREAELFTFVGASEVLLEQYLRDHLKEWSAYYALGLVEIMDLMGIRDRSHASTKTVRGWLTRTLGKDKKLTTVGAGARKRTWPWPVSGAERGRIDRAGVPNGAQLSGPLAEKHMRRTPKWAGLSVDYVKKGDILEVDFTDNDD